MGRLVTIDRNFIRQEAREAVKQFFRPITAPFVLAKEEDGGAMGRAAPGRARR